MKNLFPVIFQPFLMLLILCLFAGLPSCSSTQPVQIRNEETLTDGHDYSEHSWYDYNTLMVSGQALIYKKGYGSYVLHCQGSLQAETGETRSYHLRGIGFPLDLDGKLYFMSAGHVFDIEKEMSMQGHSSTSLIVQPPEYFLELKDRRYNLLRIDKGTLDLAIFIQQDGQVEFPHLSYRCGNSDDLRPGVPVLSWGMPLMENFELYAGIVSSLTAPPSLMQASFPEAEAEDFFVTSMPTIFGCSGAPVYAFREGHPEIVGMLVAGYININRSIVYKINSILRDSGLQR